MTRSMPWLLLALSVLFNAFFLAGYVRARHEADTRENAESLRAAENTKAGSREELVNRFADELQLDEAQKQVFTQLHEDLREEMALHRQAFESIRREIVDEMNKPAPDVARVRELMAREAELGQARRVAEAGRFEDFIRVLRPEQAQALARQLNARLGFRQGGPGGGRPGGEHGHGDGSFGRGGGGGPSPELRERFDVNRDGKLDESERTALQKFFEDKRAEADQRRADLRKRFDADGDGELSEQEQSNLREWELANPSDRGRRRGGPRPRPQGGPPPGETSPDA